MEIYTVSFFGHRRVNNPIELEEELKKIVENLIDSKEYVDFLVGRDGDFDMVVTSTIKRVKRYMDWGNSSLILVLPYMTAEYRDNEKSFHDYYDDVEICTEAAGSHFKAAFQVRNRHMIDRSDLVISYVEHNSGGAYQAKEYAEKSGKEIVEISMANDLC